MAKSFVKFGLDIIMGVVFALLFNHHVLGGLSFHETAGLAIFAAVIVHVLLNKKWVRKVTCAIFSPKTKVKTRIGYILNVLLLIDLIVIIVSGLFISKVLFSDLANVNPLNNMQQIHIATSYIALALIGVHLGLHRKWLLARLCDMFPISSKNTFRTVIAHVMMVAILVVGVYSMSTTDFLQNATTFIPNENTARAHGGNGGGNNGTEGSSWSKGDVSANSDAGTTADSENAQRQGMENASSNTNVEKTQQEGQDSFERNETNDGQSDENQAARAAYAATINPFEIAFTYLSIMGSFGVITGYIEIALRLRKSRLSKQVDNNIPATKELFSELELSHDIYPAHERE